MVIGNLPVIYLGYLPGTHNTTLATGPRCGRPWHRISYHLTSELIGLQSCWVFRLEYHASESFSLPDT